MINFIPTLANVTREWGTRRIENDMVCQNGNRVGHPAMPSDHTH